MRHRILIADDEEFERRALRQILAGAGLPELEIVEATNGREAIEFAGEEKLDAAFLDIRMPGIDGIEAARVLRARFPELSIIFLTAYDSFEYARNALRLRVEDFLLKPASAEEVIGALRHALSSEGVPGSKAVKAMLESAISYLADELRAELAAGRVPAEKAERYMGFEGRHGAILAVVALRLAPFDHASEARRPGSLRGAVELFERCFASTELVALGGAGTEHGLCLLAGEAGGNGGDEALEARLERFVERARAELGQSLLVGAAGIAENGARDPDIAAAIAVAPELGRAAQRAVALAGAARPIVLCSIQSRGETRAIDEAARRQSASAQAGWRTALRALELMESRQAEALSLEGVASELGVSASHLSRLLGRHTGLGFADCLARFRVERAKGFLAASSTSIKEVASLVGFHDPAYFARVFRRFEGMSPVEFRARSGAAEGGSQNGGIR